MHNARLHVNKKSQKNTSNTQVKEATPSLRATSFFEFWPTWIMYLPVGLLWLCLSIRYRSLTVALLANPSLHLAGMVGVSKSALMRQARDPAKTAILPWVSYNVNGVCAQQQAQACLALALELHIYLPFVCKPEIGCRGVGVKYVKTIEQLADIIKTYPIGAGLICQQLASWEPEVGIFYVRDPYTNTCTIPSMTLKTLPRVTGDGVHTLQELISKDARAGGLAHLYFERHRLQWHEIPAANEEIQLVFSASHSKGAIFTDARHHITAKLTAAIENMMQGLPDFYYGRLDVKFKDLQALKNGESLEVIEINGASAEPIHIWDKDAKLSDAVRSLLWQYTQLFKIGAYHRKKGRTPPTLRSLAQGVMLEHRLSRHYPYTD